MIVFSYIYSFFAGTTDAVTASVFAGTSKATQTVISLVGMMVLWTGLLEVAQKAGITKKIEKILSPIIRFLFPSLPDGDAKSAIAMSMTANILGLSNAATPLGLAAMEKLQKQNLVPQIASDDMCMFVVLNTASITLLPTTLLTLRASAGSIAPFEIMVPVWICSFLSVASGIVAAKQFSRR
jgi:spore maturation protein A